MNGGATFRVTAVVTVLLGALLLLGSWDGLYDRLDLPQALPALGPQLGGIGLAALAFLLWSASSTLELRRPTAIAGVLFYFGSAVLIASWLIFRDKVDLGVGDTGWAILIIAAILFAGLGAALARSASRGAQKLS
jgi:apolipoprotein N-acyltransferase